MNNRDRQICEKISAEISVVNDLMKGFSQEEFLADERTCRAVCMTLINIGELVKNLTPELKDENPHIPWRAIAGMRDITAHRYQTLRREDVYRTCVEDIPEFGRNLMNLRVLVVDDRGNEFLDLIRVTEEDADREYTPVNHALAVVKIGGDYLMGWNRWRQDWEIFGGGREENETLRECVVRECREELGLNGADFTFLGLMHYYMAPGYFNPEWHYEYGGLYGVTLPEDVLPVIEKLRTDKEEVEKLAFYSEIKGKEKIAAIDEKLLEYWE